jgi:Ca2+-binding RTX toxin-like protein
MARLSGTSEGDVLHGTMGADEIDGLAGVDRLFGDAGDDVILGDLGEDHVEGGDGADLVVGGSGADHLDGGPGYDTVRGGRGDDVLVGGPDGGALHGGLGDDYLAGGGGTLDGGDGDDRLYSYMEAGQRATQTGGEGADVFTAMAVDDGLAARADVLDFDQDRFALSADLGGSFLDAEAVFAILDTNADRQLDQQDGPSSFGTVRVDAANDTLELTFPGDTLALHGVQAVADWQMAAG